MTTLDRLWLAPAPAVRLGTVRVLVGAYATVYLLVRPFDLADFSTFDPARFEPVGLAHLTTGPLDAPLVWAGWALACFAGAGFTLGLRFTLTGPLFALSFLWVTSYRNSWGMIFHTENLTALHLLILGFTPSAAGMSLDARQRPAAADPETQGWPLRLMCAVTAIAYVIAGIAKLKNAGAPWMEGDILRNYIAYDAMRKAALGSIHSPLGAWMVQHAWPFPPLGVLTMILELGAPLALLHRRLRNLFVGGLYLFHVGVLATMAIGFPYPLSGIAFAPFFEIERIWRLRAFAPVGRLLDPPRTAA